MVLPSGLSAITWTGPGKDTIRGARPSARRSQISA